MLTEPKNRFYKQCLKNGVMFFILHKSLKKRFKYSKLLRAFLLKYLFT